MEHVVFWPARDGTPAFARVPSLEAAVSTVEMLRNDEGVVGATVHTLVEVPLTFRAYYRVEVPEPAALAPVAPVLAAANPLDGREPTATEVPAVTPPAVAPQLTVVPPVAADEAESDGGPAVDETAAEPGHGAPGEQGGEQRHRGLGFFAR